MENIIRKLTIGMTKCTHYFEVFKSHSTVHSDIWIMLKKKLKEKIIYYTFTFLLDYLCLVKAQKPILLPWGGFTCWVLWHLTMIIRIEFTRPKRSNAHICVSWIKSMGTYECCLIWSYSLIVCTMYVLLSHLCLSFTLVIHVNQIIAQDKCDLIERSVEMCYMPMILMRMSRRT
jgi:hypothetical protein